MRDPDEHAVHLHRSTCMSPSCMCHSGESSQQALYRAVQAAKHGGAETASMKALAGRAAYVPSASIAGVADPGALAVGIWLQAIHDALFPA